MLVYLPAYSRRCFNVSFRRNRLRHVRVNGVAFLLLLIRFLLADITGRSQVIAGVPVWKHRSKMESLISGGVPSLHWRTSEQWPLSVDKREDYQNCSVIRCATLCTVICKRTWAVVVDDQIPMRSIATKAPNTGGVEKSEIFHQYLAVYQRLYKIATSLIQ